MPYRIFLSHSHKDAALAIELEQSLRPKRGFSVFRANYDSALGAAIPKKIIKKMEESDLLIVIWSRNSSDSKWVNQEIGMALGLRLKILPVVHGRGLELPETLKDLEEKGKVVSLRGGREKALSLIRDAIYRNMARKGVAQDEARKRSAEPSPWQNYGVRKEDEDEPDEMIAPWELEQSD
ncbi:MAG TPA: toll/interleukin-1 receptor domain-containing protein [Pyrinomonadaceae bacterium]|nr:toll/interleukin-1 receptor domain-containing protein [Pyrinomonadaceae bacterium]